MEWSRQHMKMRDVCLLCLVIVAGFKVCGGARQLPESNSELFIARLQNPSALDPNLNFGNDVADKTEVPCEEEEPGETSADSANKDNTLTFRIFQENRTGGDAEKESPGAGHKSSAAVQVQRLSESEPSPGVGHMQIFNVSKSHDQSKKRILNSTPSPGGGN